VTTNLDALEYWRTLVLAQAETIRAHDEARAYWGRLSEDDRAWHTENYEGRPDQAWRIYLSSCPPDIQPAQDPPPNGDAS
jgi:hypothetical protein